MHTDLPANCAATSGPSSCGNLSMLKELCSNQEAVDVLRRSGSSWFGVRDVPVQISSGSGAARLKLVRGPGCSGLHWFRVRGGAVQIGSASGAVRGSIVQ